MDKMNFNRYLTHLVSGEDIENAYQTFLKIIYEGQLAGSRKWIKGGHKCICFTEHNINSFPFSEKTRYKKFGFMFNRCSIYELGAEKVIYSKEEDYSKLPVSLRWRYQLHNPPETDFSWENEVRLNKESLTLRPSCQLLIPNTSWLEKLQGDYYTLENERYYYEVEEYGEGLADPPRILNFSILCLEE